MPSPCPRCGYTSLSLSPKELEVALLLGLTNKQIATRLFVADNTVRAHIRNIMVKLAAQSRTEATLLLIRHGVIHVSDTADPDGVICEIGIGPTGYA